MAKTKTNPTVSVIMPVYNAEQFIAAAISSVLGQTFQNFEFIIIDAGSTDHTEAVLAPFKSRLTIIKTPLTNFGTAINAGLRYSRGRYIAFLDAEDTWEPHKLELQASYLDTHPDAALVYSHSTHSKHISFEGHIFPELVFKDRIDHSTVMVHRLALEAVGTFNERLKAMADYDLYLRISQKFTIGFIPRTLVHQYPRPTHFDPTTYDNPYHYRHAIYDHLFNDPAALQALGATKKTLMADFITAAIYHDLRGRHPEYIHPKLTALGSYAPWRAKYARALTGLHITSPTAWRRLIKYFRYLNLDNPA